MLRQQHWRVHVRAVSFPTRPCMRRYQASCSYSSQSSCGRDVSSLSRDTGGSGLTVQLLTITSSRLCLLGASKGPSLALRRQGLFHSHCGPGCFGWGERIRYMANHSWHIAWGTTVIWVPRPAEMSSIEGVDRSTVQRKIGRAHV